MINFHDGYLDGLRVLPEKSLILFCRQVDGKKSIITVPRIESLWASQFKEGNIIDSINFYRGNGCPEKLIRRVQGYTCQSPVEYFEKDMAEIIKNNWSLMELTTSYGCELLALFSSSEDRVTCHAE